MQAITDALKFVFQQINQIVPNYTIDILLFTVLVKIILLPFNIAQTKSTVKTQMVQPKLKQLQEKYKNDKQKLSEAQMELYKKEGVNPLAGCLPLLIQMPILIALYSVFRTYNFGEASFIGLTLSKGLNTASPAFLGMVFAVLSGLSTYVSTLLLTPKTQDQGQNPAMGKNMNLFMSVFFAYVSWTMTAGLVLYWIINNLLQLGIQYMLNKAIYKQLATAAEK